MCIPIDDTAMLCWLKTQVRVLEAWRDELCIRPGCQTPMLLRLEKHHDWLTQEVSRLEAPARAA